MTKRETMMESRRTDAADDARDGGSTYLEFTWSVSRARDTYGYNRCTLNADGASVAVACGGGFDMRGAVFGEFIAELFQEELKKLKSNRGSGDDGTGCYGLTFYTIPKTGKVEYHKSYQAGCSVSVDGSCGLRSMESIVEACGWSARWEHVTGSRSVCRLSRNV